MKGFMPVPTDLKLIPATDHVEIEFSSRLICKYCGYSPDEWGCIPKMMNHLLSHNVPDTDKLWLSGYGDTTIKQILDEQEEKEANRDF